MLNAGLQCAKLTKAKFIIHHEDDLEYHSTNSLLNDSKEDYCHKVYKEALSQCCALSAIWHPIAIKLQELKKPTLILPPGLPQYIKLSEKQQSSLKKSLIKQLKIDPNSMIIGYSGSIRYLDSEFEIFLMAFKKVLKENNRVVLLIWGRDWNPHLTFQLLKKYNLINRAFLLGLLPEKESINLQQTVDILCCPGINSEFNYYRLPSRLCSYFYFGKPVITHKIGFGESLNEVAVLTETNSPQEWASKILSLINSKELRKKLTINASTFYDHYLNVNNNTKSLIKFYNKVLNKGIPEKYSFSNSLPIKNKFKKENKDYEDPYNLCAANNKIKLRKMGITKIAFFGAGKHTRKLLESNEFNDFTIVCILDSNLTGKLKEIPIYAPSSSNLPDWDALLLSSDTQEHLMLDEAKKYSLKNIFSMYSFLFENLDEAFELNE